MKATCAILSLATLVLGACSSRSDHNGTAPLGTGGRHSSGGAGGGGSSAGRGATDAFGNSDASAPTDAAPTHDGGLLPDVGGCGHLEVRNLDLLFMVDNSGSMREEQAALRREFPKMIRVLTTGDRDADGKQDFPPIAELHLGVVSSDLGLVGITSIQGCAGLGDDGILNSAPRSVEIMGCQSTYPPFLNFRAGTDDPQKTANDFACIATLGTDGCGFEQQLESTLKALWPSSDPRITFLADTDGKGKLGHGDIENTGFLRPSSGATASMLAVVLVTDEDDCSSTTTKHFTPARFLDPADPLVMQGLNTRCHFNPQNLYSIDRYVNGFRALRPDAESLVVFGAITGVPPELVNSSALGAVDFDDEAAVAAFYAKILASPAMQEVVDDVGTPDPSDDKLVPSCISTSSRAAPPRRIVQVAQQFGKNSIVQSICQDDFGPAVDAIVLAIARASKNACIVR